jgi:hypothetical protein
VEEIEERLELDDLNGLVGAAAPMPEAFETYLANRMQDARNGIGRANPRSTNIYRSVAVNWIAPRGTARHVLP